MKNRKAIGMRRIGLALIAATLMTFGACGVDEVKMPDMTGPSTFGIQLLMAANPDQLVADGTSTSSIRVILRNNNGGPLAGRQVYLTLADLTGYYAEVGRLSETSVTTDSNGTAETIYHAPVRQDFAGNGYVLVMGRPISTDWSGELYRSVKIELRAAEGRRFPTGSGAAIVCSFVIEPATGPYAVGFPYPIQSTSTGSIARYEWDFGDGTTEDKPEVVKTYDWADTFTITHVITGSSGAQAICTKTIVVQ